MSESPGQNRDAQVFNTDDYLAVELPKKMVEVRKLTVIRWIENLRQRSYDWHSEYTLDQLYEQLKTLFPHKQAVIETELFRDVTIKLATRLRNGESVDDLADELIEILR